MEHIITYLVNRYGYERAYFDGMSNDDIINEYNETFIFWF